MRVVRAVAEATEEFRRPASRQMETAAERFARLAAQWKSATAMLSSASQMAVHPAYQEIIGMGKEAVPLLLGELKRDPDHWFWALRAITGVDPVPPSSRGNLKAMTEAWLRWGEHQGFALP